MTRFQLRRMTGILLLAAGALATSHTNAAVVKQTEITGTNIKTTSNQRNATSDQESVMSFDKQPISDQRLEQLVNEESKRLSILVRSTTLAVTRDAKDGRNVKMEVLVNNEANSRPIADVVGKGEELQGENTKRKIAERVQLERYQKGEIGEEALKQQILKSIFPIQTSLKPAKLPSRKINLAPAVAKTINQPIVVIGADAYSLTWFKANLGLIRRLKAGVIVTQVDSLQDFLAIKQFAQDIQFQPINADAFLRAVGVSVYPIIITHEGALQ